MAAAQISVLIVNYNSTQTLHPCLDAVMASSCADDLQVIVVDNASLEFDIDRMRTRYPRVQWLPQWSNLTFTGGCNAAYREAEGQLILLLNPDTRVEPTSIEAAATHLRASPDIAAIGGQLIGADGALQRDYYMRLPTLRDLPALCFAPVVRLLSRGRGLLTVNGAFGDCTDVEHVAAAFVMARREDLPDGDLLDAGYFNLISDLDLSRRLGRKGRVCVAPNVRCHHTGGGAGLRPNDLPSRLRLYQDYTWGLRRFLAAPGIRSALVIRFWISLYWVSRFLNLAFREPRSLGTTARYAWAGLVGRPPEYA